MSAVRVSPRPGGARVGRGEPERAHPCTTRSGGKKRSLPTPHELPGFCAAIYEAVLDPEAWWSLVRMLADRLDARLCGLVCCDPAAARLPFAYQHGLDAASFRRFVEAGYVNNVGTRALSQQPIGKLLTPEQVLSRKELLQDQCWREFFVPRDLERVVGAKVHSEGSCFSVLAAHRSSRQLGFAPEELAFLRALMPHLERATQITLRLGASGEFGRANLDVVERLAVAVYLLDQAGRVVHANVAARELACGDGLALASDGLVAASVVDNTALQRAILAAAATGGGRGAHDGARLTISRPSGAPPYEVIVAPLGAETGPLLGSPSRPMAAAFVSDPGMTPRIDAPELARRFGLTPAETQVALATLQANGATELAATLGVTGNTAKTHLKRIYDKTCTRGRTELVQLLLCGLSTPLRY